MLRKLFSRSGAGAFLNFLFDELLLLNFQLLLSEDADISVETDMVGLFGTVLLKRSNATADNRRRG